MVLRPKQSSAAAKAPQFSGCSLKCCFCQNYPISHENKGEIITTDRLVEIIKELENKGVHTIDFVNPTHFSHIIIDALKTYKPKVPVVYNSSGYDSVETLKQLEGLVDVYLPDLKYFSSEKSQKYAKCPDYFEKTSRAILEMHHQQPKTIIENGIIVDSSLPETQLRSAVISQSAKSVFLCDKTKFNVSASYNLMPLRDVDHIVTNKNPQNN